MSLSEAESAVALTQAAMVPMDLRELAVALDGTMALWRTPASEGVMEFYLEALQGYPPDIVHKALRHIRLTHRYPTMPQVAEFSAAAEAFMQPLRAVHVRARLARSRLDAERKRQDRWATRVPVVVGEGTPQADPDNLRVIGPARSIVRRAD